MIVFTSDLSRSPVDPNKERVDFITVD